MDNNNYIKSLEERIEKLEKLFNSIQLMNGNIVLQSSENITLSDCNIQAVALEKCKDVSVECVNAENFALAAFSLKIDCANIDRFENKSNKTKMNNCTIGDRGESSK